MPRTKDFAGDQIGDYYVMQKSTKAADGRTVWVLKCRFCGNRKEIRATNISLTVGKCRVCGKKEIREYILRKELEGTE